MSLGAVGGGIGSGLMAFAQSYAKQKQLNVENEQNQRSADMAQQRQQAGLLNQGMQVNPDSGDVEWNPTQQGLMGNQKAYQKATSDIQQSEIDPSSDESQAAYHQYVTRSEAAHPGSGQFIPQGKSALWYKTEIEPHLAQEETLANNMAMAKVKASGMTGAAQIRADSSEDVANTRNAGAANKQQNKAFTDMSNQTETFRGNKAVGNAADALRAVGNAQELLKEYPDLNQMPQAQVGQLGEELAKIAGGGTASEGGRKEVNSSSYESNFQNFMSKVGNEPTGAQLGDFLQKNVNYLGGLKDANQKIVNDFRMNKYLAYEDQLSDAQKQKFQTQMHPELFQNQQSKGQGLLGAQSAPQGGAHPQDQQAIQWAKSNPQDPRSAAILKANGVQ